ncbi:Mycothiol S-conjugate amidase [Actinomadura rubteroloni]|uniref:Mycothiol S-conjugate amidase n=1 Tax=Actinomadura rubteroloni TaxID=1926885 RepID=A0A2P4UFB1_9ACTN|nr:PIG-L family deacetylase [Actinomadura rubteroloni]POM23698.1 Mycothiol S-conjugate amidase [Actinomadura rubteroloni]
MSDLTLMAVHAHPDDEVIGTGGVLAAAAAEGIRTVLVTCTGGELGDAPGGVKPGEPGHDPADVARLRRGELAESARLLAITHVETLGYHDSGMAGWDGNARTEAFANVPVADAAARVAELMERYRPQVVVTYDENGGYGHPDHIQAHRVARAAADATGIPAKFYYTAVQRSAIQELFSLAADLGLDLGDGPPDDFGVADDVITTRVDVSAHADVKRKALEAHASQGDGAFLLSLPPDIRARVFGTEMFTRVASSVPVPDVEDDLFAGLRG